MDTQTIINSLQAFEAENTTTQSDDNGRYVMAETM